MVETHTFRLRGGPIWAAEPMPQKEGGGVAPHQQVPYLCPRGHEFEVPFAAEHDAGVEIPETWDCPRHGVTALAVGAPEQKPAKAARTHWDMLLERRSIPALEALLDERLDELARRRGEGL